MCNAAARRGKPMNIVVFVTIPAQAEFYRNAILAKHPDFSVVTVDNLDALEAEISRADILMSFGAQLRRRDLFSGARKLKWVNALGTGLDGILDAPSLDPNVIVTATRGIHGVPMSEMAFMLMLALARDFPRVVHAQDNGIYRRWTPSLLHGKTVGILGVGQIAEVLAPRCKAFGMTVVGISRTSRPLSGFDRIVLRTDLVNAVRAFDFFILLVPFDAETQGIVSRDVIA